MSSRVVMSFHGDSCLLSRLSAFRLTRCDEPVGSTIRSQAHEACGQTNRLTSRQVNSLTPLESGTRFVSLTFCRPVL